VETQGKQNKRVPILMTKDMTKAMDALVEHRQACGINPDNVYMFATSSMQEMDSWKVLRALATKAGCIHPELVSSSRLRMYMATVCQVS
jgi:hypothetical protein